VPLIGVVLGRGHDPETTKSPWLERVTGIEAALSAWESERSRLFLHWRERATFP